ncbi:single-strand DNA endonuclease 1-like [Coffea arabica]|uniref:Single-strand DNA endonuclease 1-like n=1 Tax=Coffea arabica TaxID=13443 RepID=A0ABM4WCJ6_COFAR|nr:flap endonuclease GEN-like 2 [Coffea arabica]
MGVKNLWDILESCKKILPLHHLQNKRVCIDLSCWMVQLQNVNRTHCAMTSKLYLQCLFHRLRALIALNCSLIFVTDGSIPSIKLSTYRRRLNVGSEVNVEETNPKIVSSLRRNMGSEFSCMIKEAKSLGKALGIPCLDGVEEAEAQCALLNSESLCDACFTSDSDAFLFGARTVYRDICLGEGGYVVCYEMADIERNLGFGRNSLITLAVLLGSDYSQGVYGLGQESACQIVKSVGDSAVLHRIALEGISFAQKPKVSKKKARSLSANQERDANGADSNFQKNTEFMEVINAYLKPKCHPPDSDAVYRVLAVYPFNRHQLQQICAQFFDWPPEKTDEYILPKIAERDLRRYASLRSTSSNLGVKVSMDEMPVKCPISSIIKQRKLQGRDCFEVSWEEMHGLNASVVPADLVERACPEKIVEFQERKAQGKKRNHCVSRPKKLGNMPSAEEIDLKLQKLLLDIENESKTTRGASLSGRSKLEKTSALIQADLAIQELHLEDKLEKEADSVTTMGCKSVAPSPRGTEVINLMSPLPVSAPSSTRQGANVECIDLIELSESETEISPDHARKARDLRLFIASIKDD